MAKSLLYSNEHKINDHITLKIPTLQEILENEEEYYGNIALIVATPYEMMVQLAEMDIDFTTIDEWDLFCLLFNGLRNKDLSLIFGDLNLMDFEPAINQQNNNIVLLNRKTGAVIDKEIHSKISRFLRKILCLEKNDKRPANEEAKQFMLERAKRKMKRYIRKPNKSQLEDFIIALVNTSEFPYDYTSTLNLTIYQFNASLRQIIRKIKYDNLMIGCYAGTVDMKELNQNDLNWISN